MYMVFYRFIRYTHGRCMLPYILIQQLLVDGAKRPVVDHHLIHKQNETTIDDDDYYITRFKRRWLYRFTEPICCRDTTADEEEYEMVTAP